MDPMRPFSLLLCKSMCIARTKFNFRSLFGVILFQRLFSILFLYFFNSVSNFPRDCDFWANVLFSNFIDDF